MATRLCVSLTGITTEATKTQIIEAAKALVPELTEGAAEILRDVNGKVIEVRLALPDSVAESVKTSINANSGVANVVISDILPGTTGYDSTAEGKAAFIAAGGIISILNDVDETFNADGTVTYTNNFVLGGSVDIFLRNSLPLHPDPFEIEWRMAYPDMDNDTKRSGLFLRGLNTKVQIACNLNTEDVSAGGVLSPFALQLTGAPSIATSLTKAAVGTGFNTYKIKFDGSKNIGFFNGTQVGETAAFGSPLSTINDVTFGWRGQDVGASFILDFIRWTTVA